MNSFKREILPTLLVVLILGLLVLLLFLVNGVFDGQESAAAINSHRPQPVAVQVPPLNPFREIQLVAPKVQKTLVPDNVPPGTCLGVVNEEIIDTYGFKGHRLNGYLTLHTEIIVLAYSEDGEWVVTDRGWIHIRNLNMSRLCLQELPVIPEYY